MTDMGVGTAVRPRDLVLLYGPPWDGAAQFSKHHLARYLGERGHRVLFVETPLTVLSLLYRRSAVLREWLSTFRSPRQVAPGVWVRRHFNPVPYHPILPLTDSRSANRLGQRLLQPFLRWDLAKLGMAAPTLIAGLPHALDLVDGLDVRGLVYHCADDYAHVRGFPSSLPSLEEALCRTADLVVATAQTLADARRAWNPNTHWIPNGVDLAHFTRPAEPASELAAFPRPIVGFVGGLAQWVDVDLIAQVAAAHPEWSVVLIGPISTEVGSLRPLANVHLLGPRPYAQMPEMLAAFDVALIPFVQDDVTHNADPIKAYEYLAAGVPVVATRLPALERLAPIVRLADHPGDFVRQIEAALSLPREAGREARVAEAGRHTWASRFREFERLLDEAVPW